MDTLLATFEPDLMAVGNARHSVEEVLEREGLHHFFDRARLVVDELVWNVVLHAGTPAVVRVDGGVDHIVIAVADGDRRPPEVRHNDPDALTGRGLLIVDSLADEWGWHEVGDGKVIWVRLDAVSAKAEAGSVAQTTL